MNISGLVVHGLHVKKYFQVEDLKLIIKREQLISTHVFVTLAR